MTKKVIFNLLKLSLLVASLGWIVSACTTGGGSSSDDSNEGTSNGPNIVTTIAQIGEPLSVITEGHAEVISLMGPGVDPHLYNASQSDIAKLQNADIIFYNGLNLEGNMAEILEEIGQSKPVLAIAESIDREALLEDEGGSVDPHIWFDIQLWQQAIDAAVELIKDESDAEVAQSIEEKKLTYFDSLSALMEEAEKMKDIPEEQRVLVTAHDAFGYFGRMHGLEVVGLQGLSTEDEVALSDIQSIVNLLVEKQIPAVFIESTISQDSIQSVIDGAAEEGLAVQLGGELFSDAMGPAGTEEGTYIGMYRHNVDTIYEALNGGN